VKPRTGIIDAFSSMFEEPTEVKMGPQKDTEYQFLCKYQVGPFKTESKVTKIKLTVPEG